MRVALICLIGAAICLADASDAFAWRGRGMFRHRSMRRGSVTVYRDGYGNRSVVRNRYGGCVGKSGAMYGGSAGGTATYYRSYGSAGGTGGAVIESSAPTNGAYYAPAPSNCESCQRNSVRVSGISHPVMSPPEPPQDVEAASVDNASEVTTIRVGGRTDAHARDLDGFAIIQPRVDAKPSNRFVSKYRKEPTVELIAQR